MFTLLLTIGNGNVTSSTESRPSLQEETEILPQQWSLVRTVYTTNIYIYFLIQLVYSSLFCRLSSLQIIIIFFCIFCPQHAEEPGLFPTAVSAEKVEEARRKSSLKKCFGSSAIFLEPGEKRPQRLDLQASLIIQSKAAEQ